jgi:putative transposase
VRCGAGDWKSRRAGVPLKGWRLTSRRAGVPPGVHLRGRCPVRCGAGDWKSRRAGVSLKGWRLEIAPRGCAAGRPPSWTLLCPLWHMEDTMRRNKLALFLHLVWATWDRLPLITPDIERRLYRNIESEARKQGCTVLALNGTEDHVHLLVIFPTTITIADVLKHVKGVSSRFVNETLRPSAQFKWQGSYGAFTVSRWDVARIKEYIKRQKEHHRSGELVPEFEETFEEIKSDE